MKALLIAEKPSLRREIETVYSKYQKDIPYTIDFVEQRGHLVTLLLPDEYDDALKIWNWDDLPFDPENYGGFKYKIISEKKTGHFKTAAERFYDIKDKVQSGQYDFVINAGDPDQEGELLIRSVLTYAGSTLPVKRFWTNDLTEGKILYALKNLKDDDNNESLKNLYSAALARQHSDYRFGMNISRAASLKMNSRVACGRVKLPILSIICQRQNEIDNYVESSCYGIICDYGDFKGQLFNYEADKTDESVDNGYIWFKTEEEALNLIDKLNKSATVLKCESKATKTLPPKLYKLATLQIDAGKIGYNADKTLEIAQSLYEKKFISYPRTDLDVISSSVDLTGILKNIKSSCPDFNMFVESISKTSISQVLSTKKWVNDVSVSKAGHTALIPTNTPCNLSELSQEERDIYKLICRRFVSIFLNPSVQETTTLISKIDSYYFKSLGNILVESGYAKIYNKKFIDTIVPKCNIGQVLTIKNFLPTEKTTTCPSRYTSPDLISVCESPIKFLENESLKNPNIKAKLGTPATRTGIINELIYVDKYLKIEKEGKKEYIVPTETGKEIYKNLKNLYISKVDMTVDWENKLSDIRNGDLRLAEFESNIKESLDSMILEIKNSTDIIPKPNPTRKNIVGFCPNCSKPLLASEKGFGCSGWKDGCKIGMPRNFGGAIFSDEDFLKLINGTTIEKSFRGKYGKYKNNVKYDSKNGKIILVKDEKTKIESKYNCMNCGSVLSESEFCLKCPSCQFSFWKKTCGVILSKEQIDSFFTSGSTGLIKGFTSKKGKSFDAKIIYDEANLSTKFEF